MKKFEILEKKELAPDVYGIRIYAPVISKASLPGQFVIVINDKQAERIPLTIYDYDEQEGTISIIVQAIGKSTRKIVSRMPGEVYANIVGPLGNASELLKIENIREQTILFIAGGIGAAPVFPQVKRLQAMGVKTETILGARNKELIILEEQFRKTGTTVHLCTDDGSYGYKGNVTQLLNELVLDKHKHYDHVVAIGPLIMMKFVDKTTQELNLPCIVSLNTLMIDGTGMCGACRVTVDKKTKFTCVDGPEFDGHLVDFDEALMRQANKQVYTTKHVCNLDLKVEEAEAEETHHPFDRKKRIAVKEQAPEKRIHNFDEVSLGYSAIEAIQEAGRCLQCKKPLCMDGCPVSINIPAFIHEVHNAHFRRAYEILNESTNLPSICGRVCPQETQCEGKCIMGIKNEPVAIGKLERFIGDWATENIKEIPTIKEEKSGHIAVIGSGPAGLTCAGDMRKMGYKVSVFEALQKPGGVLQYGIPEFRLPKSAVVEPEINKLRDLGVEFNTNYVIGKVSNVDKMLKNGYDAVFIGAGAGLPRFMNIPGENYNGVYSANEFLTRINLMKAYREEYDTPSNTTEKVVVVGGGNVAMDSARTALRMGSDVTLVYRRSLEELPARKEEVHHAMEEGIKFQLLSNPIEIIGDEKGSVIGVKCIKMQLTEPDASGRRRPVAIPGSEFIIETGSVIISIGTNPNPLISLAVPNVDKKKNNCIEADYEDGKTSEPGVFAGGDVVSGAATVIEAMGAGKRAAIAMDKYITEKKSKL